MTVFRLIPAFILLGLSLSAGAQDSARQVVINAANAMGGVAQVEAVSSVRLVGYGHEAYQDGGSEITTEANAPEKMTNLTAYERVIDLDNNRTRVKARMYRAFIFAARSMMQGLPVNQVLDGDIAYDVSADGNARRRSEGAALTRRMDMLSIPLVAVRAALDENSTVNNRRDQDGLTLVDVITADGTEFTLALNNESDLPHWVRWLEPHENLGEITQRAEYSAWLPVDGILLPMSYNTVSDWKETVMLRLHVDRYVINGAIDDLAAPASIRTSTPPVPNYTVTAEPVAEHVWHLIGNNGANSVLLEFDDHLALFEVPTNRTWTQAVIDEARRTVPGKPLTQAIITHHHFDHTGGLRVAIAEGLTIVTQAGNVDWFRELSERPVTKYHDALSRNPQPLKSLAVDDHLRLSDTSLTIDIYHMVANAHMAHGLMGFIPEHKLFIQGDLFDLNWEVYFWGNTYDDNIAYRNLDVERDIPIHGRVTPVAEVHRILEQQKGNARALCSQVANAGLSMPGCPLAWD